MRLDEARAELPGLVAEVLELFDDDPGHDLSHALRVATWTVRVAEEELPKRLVLAAALLHDSVNVPKNSPDRARASELSAALARELLPRHGFPPGEVALVCDAIRDHSHSRGSLPESALGRALKDADRLEALGALGLCRTLSTGARMGARYFDAEDPWAERRPLDDLAFSVDHFFTKLMGLPARMLTPRGREEACRRVELLRSFLQALAREIDVAVPPARRAVMEGRDPEAPPE
ncbi:MAG: HD domain-containing protein [Polyangiaceae bacterium]